MPANVEIKARIANSTNLFSALKAIGARPLETVKQEDTFFSVPRGRLKMRCDEQGFCELVYYLRENQKAPSISNYFRRPLANPPIKRAELENLFGVKGTVRKHRQVFIASNARIHIDDVEGLGRFLEIEVAVDRKCDANRATHFMRSLMEQLSISDADLIADAYEDMATFRE